jgi:hypothetical protein
MEASTDIKQFHQSQGPRGSVVGSGTILQGGRLRVRFSMSADLQLSSRITVLGSIQPLTVMNNRNLPAGKARQAG